MPTTPSNQTTSRLLLVQKIGDQVATHEVKPGVLLRIKLEKPGDIEIIDSLTSKAPPQVTVKRQGNDLWVKAKHADDTESEALLEDYYADDHRLIGLNDAENYVEYVPSSDDFATVALLSDGVESLQVLGVEAETGALVGLGIGEWFVNGVAGVAVVGLWPDGFNKFPQPTKPAAPIAGLAPDSDTGIKGDNITSDRTPTLTGSGAQPGGTITVQLPDGTQLTTRVQADGTWSLTPTTSLADGSNAIVITQTSTGGETSTATTLTLVIQNPTAPALTDPTSSAFTNPTGPTFAVIDDVPGLTGAITGGSTTNDEQPTFKGSGGIAGDTIHIYKDSNNDGAYDASEIIATTTVDANGRWSVDPTSPLGDGSFTYAVVITDSLGHTSNPGTINFGIETVAPIAPTITDPTSPEFINPTVPTFAVIDDVLGITGAITGGTTTNDKQPTFKGIGGLEGETVHIYKDSNNDGLFSPGEIIATTTVDANGRWSVDPTSPLGDGSFTYGITLTDSHGNESTPGTISFGIETVAPIAPTITDPTSPEFINPTAPTFAVIDDVLGITGAITGGSTTNDKQPTFKGSGGIGGETVHIYKDSNNDGRFDVSEIIATTTVDANGRWSVDPASALGDGSFTYGITLTDSHGNEGTPGTITFGIETVAPIAPTITDPTSPEFINPTAPTFAVIDDVLGITGAITGGTTTNDKQPTFKGSGGIGGETVHIYKDSNNDGRFDVSEIIATTTVDANGRWSVDPTLPLGDGTFTYGVTLTDSHGNEGAPGTISFEVDSAAPTSPTVSVPEATGGINASEVNDGISVIVTLPSNAKEGDVIGVSIGGRPTAVSYVVTAGDLAGAGPYTHTLTLPTSEINAVGDGATNIATTYKDSSGNPATEVITNVNIDTQAPDSPSVSVPEAVNGINQAEATDGGGVDVIVTLPSNAKEGDVITVSIGGRPSVVSYVVTAGDLAGVGPYSHTLTLPSSEITAMGDGTTNITTTYKDSSGNPATDVLTSVNIDLTPPGSPSVSVPEAVNGISQAEATNGGGVDVIVTLPANAAVGDVIAVSIGGRPTAVSYVVTAADLAGVGPYTHTLTLPSGEITAVGDGTTNITTTYVDNHGTPAATINTPITIDLTPPGLPIVSVPEAANGINALEASDGIGVNVTLPSNAALGDVITVSIDGSSPVTRTVTAGDLTSGTLTLTLSAADITAAGQGLATITTTYKDNSGNPATDVTTNVTIDTQAPTLPTVSVPEAAGGINALEASDGVGVNVTLPGNAAVGDVITVSIDGSTPVIYTVTAGDLTSGNLTLTLTAADVTAAGQGAAIITTTYKDSSGNPATDVTTNVNIDLDAPVASVFFKNISVDTGTRDDDYITSDPTLVIFSQTNQALATGEKVQIDLGSGWLDMTYSGSLIWKYDNQSASLSETTHTFKTRIIDSSGNPNDVSKQDVQEVKIDRTTPTTTAAVTAITDNFGSITGTVAKGGRTDDTSLDISGTLNANLVTGEETVRIYDGVTYLGMANVTGTDWTYTDTRLLSDGQTVSYTARVADTAGWQSTAGAAYTATIDTSAPTSPTVNVPEAAGGINALEASDGVGVNVTLPGNAAVGDVITVSIDGSAPVIHTVTPANLTSGSVTLTLAAAAITAAGQGPATITTTYKDKSGNPATDVITNVNIDTQAPDSPSVSVPEAANGINALEASDGVGVSVTLPGNAALGDVITVSIDGSTPVTHTVTAGDLTSGTLTLMLLATDITAAGQGSATITTTYKDSTGNPAPDVTTSVTIDTQAPSSPTVNVPEADDGQINQAEASDGVGVNVTLPGNAAVGDVITVSIDGSSPVTRNVTAGDLTSGTLTLTLSAADITAAGQGSAIITTTYKDNSGNPATDVTTNVTIDTQAPTLPTVSVPEAAGGINALEASDGVGVNVTLPGNAAVGDVITVSIDGSTPVTHTVTIGDLTSGTLTLTLPASDLAALSDGLATITTTYKDKAGNPALDVATPVTLDLTPPGATSVSVPEAANGINLAEATDDGGVKVIVTLPTNAGVGDLIAVSIGGRPTSATHTVTAGDLAGAGPHTYTLTLPTSEITAVGNGTNNITTTYTDGVNPVNTINTAVNIDLDAPVASVFFKNISVDTGTRDDDYITSDPTLVIFSQTNQALATGEKVQIDLGSGWLDMTYSGSLIWKYDNQSASLSETTHTFKTRIIDSSGNPNDVSKQDVQEVKIDRTTPTTTAAVTAITDNFGSITGTVAKGGRTDDTSLDISGTLNANLVTGEETVRIYDGATYLGMANVTGTDWTYTDTRLLSNGQTVSYTARVADTAGWQSTAGAAYTATIDTSAPTQTITIDSISFDSGINDSGKAEFVTNDSDGLTITAYLSAGLNPGEVVEYHNGTTWATVAAGSISGTTITLIDASLTTSRTIKFRVSDGASYGAESPSQLITIDTSTPLATAEITRLYTDAAPFGSAGTANLTTSDKTLTFGGTVTSNIDWNKEKVQINLGDGTWHDTARDVGNTWYYDNTGTTFSLGLHQPQVRVVDTADNHGTAHSADIYVVPFVSGVSGPVSGFEGDKLEQTVTLSTDNSPVAFTVTCTLSGKTPAPATIGTDTGTVEVNTGSGWTTVTLGAGNTFNVSVPANTGSFKVRVATVLDTTAELSETYTLAASSVGQVTPAATGDATITELPVAQLDWVGTTQLNNANVSAASSYNYKTGSFYKLGVADTWENQNTAAANLIVNGVHGMLLHVGSGVEDVYAKSQTNGYFGASDKATEGTWRYYYGAIAGEIFWTGREGLGGSAQGGAYKDWEPSTNSPNDNFGEDYAYLQWSSGHWDDSNGSAGTPGLIEWQGTAVFQTPVFSTGTGSIKVNSTHTGTAYLVKSDLSFTSVSDLDALLISQPTKVAKANVGAAATNKILNFEDFATATTGWASTANAGSATGPGSLAGSTTTDHFLGQFYDTTGSEVVSRQYSFGAANANTTVQIEFDMFELGSWDNELFKVYVNGTLQTAQAYAVDTYGGTNGYATGAWDGGVKLGDLSNLAGGNNDEMHHYVLTGTTDGSGNLKLGFGSNLNEGIANESWGIDNVAIKTVATSTTLGFTGLDNGTYYLYTSDASGHLSSTQTAGNYQANNQAIVINEVAPTLISSTPSDNAAGFTANANLVFNFSEAIVSGTGSITLHDIGTGVDKVISVTDSSQVSISGSTLTLNPTADLFGSHNYAVHFDNTAVKDTTGHAYAGIADNSTLNFTVATSGAAPTDTFSQVVYDPTLHSITLYGTNMTTLGAVGTNIALQLDWSKMSYDFSANTGNNDYTFTAADIASAVVTDATHLTITLSSQGQTNVEGNADFQFKAGGTGLFDFINIGTGFSKTYGGMAATGDALSWGVGLNLGTLSNGNALQLINPVRITDGKQYFALDVNRDYQGTNADAIVHDPLDNLLNGGQDTIDTQIAGAIKGLDDERTAIVQGYTLVLPTQNELGNLWNYLRDNTPNATRSPTILWPGTDGSSDNYWSATKLTGLGVVDTSTTQTGYHDDRGLYSGDHATSAGARTDSISLNAVSFQVL